MLLFAPPAVSEEPGQLTHAPPDKGRSPAGAAAAPRAQKKKARAVGPKRAWTPYIFYAAEARALISEQQPELKMTDQAKLMGAQWKALSAAEKQKYHDMAKKDKERYEAEKKELYSDFGGGSASGSASAFGSKRKHSRWSDEEVAHLKSVCHRPLPHCCHHHSPAALVRRAELSRTEGTERGWLMADLRREWTSLALATGRRFSRAMSLVTRAVQLI